MTALNRSITITIVSVFLLFGGYWWWSHSDFVTFQEYEPTTQIAGLKITDKRVRVTSNRHHHIKTLELNLGTTTQLIEQDNSVYSNHTVSCQGYITDCRTLTTPQQLQLRIVLVRPATNLPPNKITVEAIKGKTDLILTMNDTKFPDDNDLSAFFDSMHSVHFKSIPVVKSAY